MGCSVAFVLLGVPDFMAFIASKPWTFYPWFMLNYLAGAILLVALGAGFSSFGAWLEPRWGTVVGILWVVGMALGAALLHVAA
jgi:hypothetical protein